MLQAPTERVLKTCLTEALKLGRYPKNYWIKWWRAQATL